MGVFITIAGIPIYFLCVVWKDKPKGFQHAVGKYIDFEPAVSAILELGPLL